MVVGGHLAVMAVGRRWAEILTPGLHICVG